MYTVKEIFYTLQGEGANAGRPAVFCRFSGCNLWTGREADRATAVCDFCDTDFVGIGPDGGKFATADDWPTPSRRGGRIGRRGERFVVCTGGEPLLQLDDAAIDALHATRIQGRRRDQRHTARAAGTRLDLRQPEGCAPTRAQRSGNELKLVFPATRFRSGACSRPSSSTHFFLQPMDGPRIAENTRDAIAYCLAHPRWRLSIQTHKLLGLR